MILIIAILLGFVAGWLVNYLSDILPTLHTPALPNDTETGTVGATRELTRPVCAHCGTPFRWQDYFLVNACRECKRARSWRTYIVLVTAPIISSLLWLSPPPYLGTWIGLLVLTYFGVVLVIDLEHRLILNIVSLAGAGIGLLAGVLANGPIVTLAGGLAGLVIMFILYQFGVLFARYRAHKLGVEDDEEALGFGDVILSGVLGLMLGWPHIVTGLVIGFLAGGLVSLLIIIVLVVTRRYQSMSVFIAYGPYLVLGTVLLLYFPQAAGFFIGR